MPELLDLKDGDVDHDPKPSASGAETPNPAPNRDSESSSDPESPSPGPVTPSEDLSGSLNARSAGSSDPDNPMDVNNGQQDRLGVQSPFSLLDNPDSSSSPYRLIGSSTSPYHLVGRLEHEMSLGEISRELRTLITGAEGFSILPSPPSEESLYAASKWAIGGYSFGFAVGFLCGGLPVATLGGVALGEGAFVSKLIVDEFEEQTALRVRAAERLLHELDIREQNRILRGGPEPSPAPGPTPPSMQDMSSPGYFRLK